MLSPDADTVQTLRSDLALQIARHLRSSGLNQVAASKHLQVPQPTLSKIANGRISELSLELLIRIAVRAELPFTLQTGRIPAEAGVYVAARPASTSRNSSEISRSTRRSLEASERRLTAPQRLEAFLEHNQLAAMFKQAGRAAQRHIRTTPDPSKQ